VKVDEALCDPAIYAHLHDLAGRIFRERGGASTLQPTAILHEAWLKVQRHGGDFVDRRHFVAVTCRAMRQILVDHARGRKTDKRGGELRRTTLDGVGLDSDPLDLLALDRALDELTTAHPRAAQVAQLRAFGGLTVPEIAEHLELSTSTVDRSWRTARAFLSVRLGG